jgi:predicted transcriptional regulator
VLNLSAIGELESEILAVLKEKGSATAADVLEVLKDRRDMAYTTVSTTLDRLHKKNLVGRKALRGPGGTRYLFSASADEKRKTKIIESTLNRLTSAFGESAYSAIYKHLQTLPPSELERLKKQVDRAKRTKN